MRTDATNESLSLNAGWIFGFALLLGAVGGALYFPLSAAVSDAGWAQRSVNDGFHIAIGDVTLFRFAWEQSIVTPLAQDAFAVIVPPVVGILTGVLAAAFGILGCRLGGKNRLGAQRSGILWGVGYTVLAGLALSAIADSMLALVYALVAVVMGAAFLFGLQTAIARRRLSSRNA